MYASFIDFLAPCTIASGSAGSTIMSGKNYHDAAAIMIQAPAALDGGYTYILQVNSLKDGTGAWSTLVERTGLAVYLPAASQALWYPELCTAPAWRILGSGNAAADRTFIVTKHHTV